MNCMNSDLRRTIPAAVGNIAAEGLSFGIIVVDNELNIIYWNGWMEKHSGIREEEILGRKILEQWPEIRQRGKDLYLIDCIEHQRTALISPLLHEYFIPLTVFKGQHQAIQMQQNVKIYPFMDGEIQQGAIIFIQDMTESILYEREIRRLTQLLSGIRNLNKLMVRVENEEELLDGACDILVSNIGYQFAWIGIYRPDLSGIETIAAAPESLAKKIETAGCTGNCPVLQSGSAHTLDDHCGASFARCCPTIDFPVKFRNVCCLPLRSDSRINGVLHICSDDDDPFQAEEMQLLEEYASDIVYALERLRDRLRREAAEAALRENESRLRQSQKMEAIGVLAGGIAHDFNNILYPIIGFAEMISDVTPENVPTSQYILEVLTAAYRARDLVQQILAFSRQSEQSPEPVFLPHILKETLQLMRASMPSTIEIRADIDKGCGAVLADPTHIYQLVINLCANAFQAMEESGGVLEIDLREVMLYHTDEDGEKLKPHIRLSVRDTGAGIDPSIRDRIFEPYFTTKEQGKGTGMGLSVVHGIMEQLGGRIDVTSESGKGTSFDLYLPRMESANPSSMPVVASAAPVESGTEHILVVDDEIAILHMVETMLDDLGYTATTLHDPEEALSLFNQNPFAFDLVITDLTMPNLSGDVLARKIMEIRPDIPVILCTGYRDKLTAHHVQEKGIRKLLEKPVSSRVLTQVVRTLLDGGEA